MKQNSIPYRYFTETIGIPIEIISNGYNEFHGNEHQNIVFQIKAAEQNLFYRNLKSGTNTRITEKKCSNMPTRKRVCGKISVTE